ncbi:hypothetical protein N0B44_12505 [Roseibacterium beibuensis]|uniref:hypothetical protein n=1 Tax=[Roseibacterium] beibuensis TaxID=1193142 RepID=UPI00217DA543|nr:hypothetical protein [Roseibacterium beibuensis]MCS6623735.1 hypothetical protein [Roseibacterium beibuensis]
MAEKVGSRRKDLDQDSSYVVLNKFGTLGDGTKSIMCGELLYVRSGKEVPGLVESIDDDIPELEIATLTLDERNSLVDGILYFGLIDNHLAIIEGQRARARTLERYLTALLKDAGELEFDRSIILNTRIEGLQAQNISRLQIKPPRAKKREETENEAEEAQAAGSQKASGHTVMDVLRVLGVDRDELQKLEESIPPGGWIEGIFSMTFKQKGNRKGTVSREQLETAFRNLNDQDIGLFEPGGSSESKGGLKLGSRREIATVGPLLDREAAMQAIVDMLKTWARTGKIDLAF